MFFIIPIIKKYFELNVNKESRNSWLKATLASLPSGSRLLDAGAGELRNKPLCSHLVYVSQDSCQYEGAGDAKWFQTGKWNSNQIDIVCDIKNIPEADASFDVILCSEVFEHLPDPLKALDKFERLLRLGVKIIVTAPFLSLVQFSPYHYATGFSRYWYEYDYRLCGLKIEVLIPNEDWFDFVRQEMLRLPSGARGYRDWRWPLAYVLLGVGLMYFSLRSKTKKADDLACFGWHSVAVKR